MADVYCPKCGEPTDADEFHDAAIGLETTYNEVARRFRTEGCEALPGWRCNPDRYPRRAALAREVYAVAGDDMDGAAADLDTMVKLDMTTPTPAATPNVYQFNLTAADADRLARSLAAVQPWIPPDAVRAGIHQVHVEVQTHNNAPVIIMQATDAYGLVRVVLPRPNMNDTNMKVPFTFGIHADAVKPWIKQLATKHAQAHTLTIDTTAETATLTTAGTTTTYPLGPVDQFPNTAALWPGETTHERASFNPERLARLMKSAEAIAPRRDRNDLKVTVEHLDPRKPSQWATVWADIEWTAILMPMR